MRSVLALLAREKRKIRVAVFTQRRTQRWTTVGMNVEIGKGMVALIPGAILCLFGRSLAGEAVLLSGVLLVVSWAGFVCWCSFRAAIDLNDRAYHKVTRFQLSRDYWGEDRG